MITENRKNEIKKNINTQFNDFNIVKNEVERNMQLNVDELLSCTLYI